MKIGFFPKFLIWIGLLAGGLAGPAHALDAPTTAEIDSLIQAYGPLLKLHPTDPYRPDDPARTLDNSDTRRRSYVGFSAFPIFNSPTSSVTILQDMQPYAGDPAPVGDEVCGTDPNACVDPQFWICLP